MAVLFDYFAASSDAEAALAVHRPGGPGQPAESAPAKRKGIFSRRHRVDDHGHQPTFQTVADTGIDPVVKGGTLEELLTGRPYAAIAQDARSGHALAVRHDGERLVLTLTDGLVDALAKATPERLGALAVPWSGTEEFMGAGDPEQLASLLLDLSALARDARARGGSVYCWVSV